MSFFHNIPRVAVILTVLVAAAAGPARSQEVSESHLAAALDAITSAGASKGFDTVLPALSEAVQNQLIRIRPDLHKQIGAAVQAVALKLVPKRADLDRDVAAIWAQNFTEEELLAIAAFYRTPAGSKFAEVGPRVIQQAYDAVSKWTEKMREEMVAQAQAELKAEGIEF